MTRLFLVVAMLLTAVSRSDAEVVNVVAGDHDGFTRLALTFAVPPDWQLGRTADGYALSIGREDAHFDLSQVFRVIAERRLSAIWMDPATGNLRIRVGCACHAIPFEFRPDVLVIDIRDGPPPAGSSFETGPEGEVAPPLGSVSVLPQRPRSRPQTGAWVDSGSGRVAAPRAVPPLPVLDIARTLPAPGLDTLRRSLAEEFARAASAGLLDLAVADTSDAAEPSPGTARAARSGPLAHVAFDAMPGVAAAPANEAPGARHRATPACIAEDRLDLASWGDMRPFDDQLSEARAALVGEFDRPEAEAVAKLVKLYLFFGFGAEARSVLKSFPVDHPDAGLWENLARLVDAQQTPPDDLLSPLEACPGAAALWASVALAVLAPPGPDRASVLTAFSALPVHLRRLLGPDLAQKFLSLDDVATAQAIRDAIWRAPGDVGAGTTIMEARLEAERGNLSAADALLDGVARSGDPEAAQALVDLVDLRLAQNGVIAPSMITELAALVHEQDGSPLAPALVRAEMLARGSAGDFDGAFLLADRGGPSARSDLWALLARSGPDSALMAYAVLAGNAEPPDLEPGLRRIFARRLLDLGFAEAALAWLPADQDPQNTLLAAQAALSLDDPRTALRRLAGQTGGAADGLRADALLRLNEPKAAAEAFDRSGEDRRKADALWIARDWSAASQSAEKPQQDAVDLLTRPDAVPAGDGSAPLAEGRALVAESGAARGAIETLLAAAPAAP